MYAYLYVAKFCSCYGVEFYELYMRLEAAKYMVIIGDMTLRFCVVTGEQGILRNSQCLALAVTQT